MESKVARRCNLPRSMEISRYLAFVQPDAVASNFQDQFPSLAQATGPVRGQAYVDLTFAIAQPQKGHPGDPAKKWGP